MKTEKSAARILIVDDAPDVGVMISRWLEREGYSCVTATSGEMAVDLMEEGEFHLVLAEYYDAGNVGGGPVDIRQEPISRYSAYARCTSLSYLDFQGNSVPEPSAHRAPQSETGFCGSA